MIKEIKDYINYFVDENGIIYSSKNKNKELRPLKPWLDSKGRYYMIGLCKNNKVKKFLVHRIVAQTFLENNNNFPVVDHKDNNTKNNKIDNLQWCSNQFNVLKSYETMVATRNYRKCFLFIKGEKVDEFNSILDACKYASNNYNYNFSMLYKHLKQKDCVIVRKCND